MRAPHVRVLLGHPDDTNADIVIHAGSRASQRGRVVTVVAPLFRPPEGPEHLLADAYRQAMAAANARDARSMAVPALLARSYWPLDALVRVGLTVLVSTPTTLREIVVTSTAPGMVERWAEAILRESSRGAPFRRAGW